MQYTVYGTTKEDYGLCTPLHSYVIDALSELDAIIKCSKKALDEVIYIDTYYGDCTAYKEGHYIYEFHIYLVDGEDIAFTI